MKNLLILITIMLVGGCDKSPTLEERVVGEYVHGAWTYSLNYNPNKFHEYVRGEREHTGTWTIKDGELHCKEDPQSDYTFEENGPDGKNFYVTKGEYGGATRVFSIDTNGYITKIAVIEEVEKKLDDGSTYYQVERTELTKETGWGLGDKGSGRIKITLEKTK